MTPDEVKSMSKHKVDNFDRSYACQVSIPVCCCLAGFLPKKEEYYVPRATIEIPQTLSLEHLTAILFPDYTEWKGEIESEHGDKSKGAEHFFYEIIPFFVQCIIQDGIYWIQKFPRNPAVQLLLKRLDGKWPEQNYSMWARDKRRECKEKMKVWEDSRNLEKEKLVHELGKARVAAETALEEKRKLGEEIAHLRTVNHQILQCLQSLQEKYITLSSVSNNSFTAQQSSLDSVEQEQLPRLQMLLQQDDNQEEQQQLLRQQQPQQQEQQQQQEQLQQPQQQQLQHLRSFESRLVPTVESLNSYKTVRNLVEHYYDHAHHLLATTKESDIIGCRAQKMTYSKIKRIHKRVDDKMIELEGSLENAKKKGTMTSRGGVLVAKVEAAQYIDVHERKDLSLNKYDKYLNSDRAFGGRYRGVECKRKQNNIST